MGGTKESGFRVAGKKSDMDVVGAAGTVTLPIGLTLSRGLVGGSSFGSHADMGILGCRTSCLFQRPTHRVPEHPGTHDPKMTPLLSPGGPDGASDPGLSGDLGVFTPTR